MILVVCALAQELRGFASAGVEVVAVGVGPVEAAVGAARALACGRYAVVINAGIGGGFAGQADVGEAVAVTHDRYIEIGREDQAELRLPGNTALVVEAASDSRLLERLSNARPPALLVGTAVTSATITTSAGRATALAQAFAPCVESMEGFAVLRASTAFGVPAIELRGISNIVGDRATSRWDFRAGSSAAVRALQALLAVVDDNP